MFGNWSKDGVKKDMVCCFLGHGDAPQHLYLQIETAVERLIQNRQVNEFLVGNQGQFDRMALSVLRRIKEKYPQISYYVVLAYMPKGGAAGTGYEAGETVFPEGIEYIHPRYAISWRNRWLVEQSDFVICYVKRSWGGAMQYVKMAERRGKEIINLAKEESDKKIRWLLPIFCITICKSFVRVNSGLSNVCKINFRIL